MGFDVVCMWVGALAILAAAVGVASLMVSYAHLMWSRFSARSWYYKGRRDEKIDAPDFFEEQPRPSWLFK